MGTALGQEGRWTEAATHMGEAIIASGGGIPDSISDGRGGGGGGGAVELWEGFARALLMSVSPHAHSEFCGSKV
jgi:hypothetical protein